MAIHLILLPVIHHHYTRCKYPLFVLSFVKYKMGKVTESCSKDEETDTNRLTCQWTQNSSFLRYKTIMMYCRLLSCSMSSFDKLLANKPRWPDVATNLWSPPLLYGFTFKSWLNDMTFFRINSCRVLWHRYQLMFHKMYHRRKCGRNNNTRFIIIKKKMALKITDNVLWQKVLTLGGINKLPVKRLDTPSHSMAFIYFLYCRLILNYKRIHTELCCKQKRVNLQY